MLNSIYKAIKQQLNTADEDLVLKGIEWYNVQYESTIASTPRIFVEFPDPLKFDHVSKEMKRTPVKIRLHVVTQALTGTDGTIPDTMVAAHEVTANFALDTLKRFVPKLGEVALTSPFDFTVWQHWHKHKGWMVTFVEFEAKKVL
jgi:hypothetical protein